MTPTFCLICDKELSKHENSELVQCSRKLCEVLIE